MRLIAFFVGCTAFAPSLSAQDIPPSDDSDGAAILYALYHDLPLLETNILGALAVAAPNLVFDKSSLLLISSTSPSPGYQEFSVSVDAVVNPDGISRLNQSEEGNVRVDALLFRDDSAQDAKAKPDGGWKVKTLQQY